MEGAFLPLTIDDDILRLFDAALDSRDPDRALHEIQSILAKERHITFLKTTRAAVMQSHPGCLRVVAATPPYLDAILPDSPEPYLDLGRPAFGFGRTPALLVWEPGGAHRFSERAMCEPFTEQTAPAGDKKIVRLWDQERLALVLGAATHVHYSNQVCGHCCMQPEFEGAFVPLASPSEAAEAMTAVTLNEQWLTPELADMVDAVLERYSETSCMRVDRTMLSESMEAWIYVIVDADRLGTSGFGLTSGVLTWENSD